jgi:hypothetical protein
MDNVAASGTIPARLLPSEILAAVVHGRSKCFRAKLRTDDETILLSLCKLNPKAPLCVGWLQAAASGNGPCVQPGWDGVLCGSGWQPLTVDGTPGVFEWFDGMHRKSSMGCDNNDEKVEHCGDRYGCDLTGTCSGTDSNGRYLAPIPTSDYDRAKALRKCATKGRVSQLDLAGQQLTTLPPEFPELLLCELNLQCNDLLEVPAALADMQLVHQHKGLLRENPHLKERPWSARSQSGDIWGVNDGEYLDRGASLCKQCPCLPLFSSQIFDGWEHTPRWADLADVSNWLSIGSGRCEDAEISAPDYIFEANHREEFASSAMRGNSSFMFYEEICKGEGKQWACVEKKLVCDEDKSVAAAYVGGLLYFLYLMALGLLFWLLTTSEWDGFSELDGDDTSNSARLAEATEESDEAYGEVSDARSTATDVSTDVQSKFGARFKIVWVQMQVCLMAISVDFNWPDLLKFKIRFYFDWLQLESAQFVPIPCFFGGGDNGRRGATYFKAGCAAIFGVAILLYLCLLLKKARSTSSAPAAKRAAHITNFLWATYMLLSPFVWALVVQQEYDEGHQIYSAMVRLSIPFLIISVAFPAAACYNMAKAKAADKLHTLPFTARYGWLCESYVQNCYWWELVALNGRMLMAFSDILTLAYGAEAAVATYLLVTLLMLGLQLRYKPFLESSDEAAKWSSPNKQSALAHIATIVILLIGLVSLTSSTDPHGGLADVLALIGIVAVLTPAAMTFAIFILSKTQSEPSESAGAKVTVNPLAETE